MISRWQTLLAKWVVVVAAILAADRAQSDQLVKRRLPVLRRWLSDVVCAIVDKDGIALEDRIEMDDLLTRYASAIDGLDWDLLDTVFTSDSHLDYRSAGGVEEAIPKFVDGWPRCCPYLT